MRRPCGNSDRRREGEFAPDQYVVSKIHLQISKNILLRVQVKNKNLADYAGIFDLYDLIFLFGQIIFPFIHSPLFRLFCMSNRVSALQGRWNMLESIEKKLSLEVKNEGVEISDENIVQI